MVVLVLGMADRASSIDCMDILVLNQQQGRAGPLPQNFLALSWIHSEGWASMSLLWVATLGACHLSGGHDATLLTLDLEELGHAREILLVGLGHLLLSCLWVHNLQTLDEE